MINFFVSYKKKKLYISDYPLDRAKNTFGFDIELINSIKDKEHIELIKARILRSYPGFTVVQEMLKPKRTLSPEHRQALIDFHTGRKRSEETKKNISESKKGKVSNFKGKKLSYESRRMIAAAKYGNQHSKDTIWIYNPDTDEERKTRDRREIPKGFSEGRDYYSVEEGLYVMNVLRPRNSK